MNNEIRPRKHETTSGIVVRPVYTSRDETSDETQLGNPGEWPFTRGAHANMYRDKLWTMRQYAGFGTAEDSNDRYRFLLSQGQTGLSVAFDLPTQMGRDSDHPRALGEVGRLGVAIDSLADMETLLRGIPLDKVTTSMTINATASMLLALHLAVAEKQGVPWSKVGGTTQNDILKEFISRKTYIYPPTPSLRIVTDVFDFCSREVPLWNTISISGYHMREAGSTAAQELAFTLANGIAYVEAALAAGLDLGSFAGRLSFFFNVHNNLFEEIAKFRAARRMWAHLMKERFGASKPRSMLLRTHAQTAGSTLHSQQPDNNVIRGTIQALAAVLGGTQSLNVSCRDEEFGLPTEQAQRISLRTQQIIAFESGVIDTADPLAGSYYIEWLTDEIQKKAQAYLDTIDALGGAVRAIEHGYQEREISKAAYLCQIAIDHGEQIVVGVNAFTVKDEQEMITSRPDPAVEQRQRTSVAKVRAERSKHEADLAITALETSARDGSNVMPRIIEAARAYVTIGEMSDALRRVFGEYRAQAII